MVSTSRQQGRNNPGYSVFHGLPVGSGGRTGSPRSSPPTTSRSTPAGPSPRTPARLPPGSRTPTASRYLLDSGNDLVGLARILGHESLNTTARYAKRSSGALAEAAEKLTC